MSENPKQSLNSEMSENLDNLIIDEMKKEDLDQIVKIEEQSFSDPWQKNFFFMDIENPSALPLVAKLDQKVVGYICLWMILDEIQISNIAVTPELRKKGIGQKMIQKLLKMVEKKDFRRITLDVRMSNQPAINLYEKFGFQKVGQRKNYYRKPQEDALLMEKILR